MTSLLNMESKSLIFRRAAQGFLSDVYKNKYTSEKIASMTPEEQTPMRIFQSTQLTPT